MEGSTNGQDITDQDVKSQKEFSVAPSPPLSTLERDTEKSVQTKPAGRQPPDGGVAAWLVVLGAWCTSFCSFGWVNSVGVFQEYYQNDLLRGYSPSTISWIASLQIFLMLALGPFVGAIYDHHGPRGLLFVGTLFHVFGLMMASLGTEYYQLLLAQGICSAIGVSSIFQPSVTCVATWFTKKRGIAIGVAFTGSSIGGIVFPIMVSHLIRSVGFGWAMRICAFLILSLLIIANLTVRPFQPPTPYKVTGAQLLKPLREIEFLLIAAGSFIFGFGFFAPLTFIPVEALAQGMNDHLAEYLLSILNAGSLFGRLSTGFFGDKVGYYNTFIISCYGTGLWILVLWLPGASAAATIAFTVLFGFFSGGSVSLLTPLVMAVSPMAEVGFRMGIVLFVTGVGMLVTSPICGAIADLDDGWTKVKIFAGVFCLAGTTFILVARLRKTGLKAFVRF
ncbi:putative MFS transporter [Clohesyomyces aquaticus]|uniref:Putative MFS transporter n=1 Tax=Clohesyomyces aquaticus TaxID=1231657 RepID=A0A1Y1ZJA5_9PLEO|nr:putative MFS transporter [Clohesyomyces aquaticus]